MWQARTLQHSETVRHFFENGGESTPPNFSVQGVKIGVHNWTHGINTPSGRYLSPENAVKAISAKLSDGNDSNRPSGEMQSVLIMVTAPTVQAFKAEIEKVALILPEPIFKQAFDYAKSSEILQTEKMIKTPPIFSPAFPGVGDITPASGRTLQNFAKNNKTEDSDPFQAIAQLKQRKAEKESEERQKALKILNTKASVFAFEDSGELGVIAENLIKNIPNNDYVFTAIICFIGPDLRAIKDLLRNE